MALEACEEEPSGKTTASAQEEDEENKALKAERLLGETAMLRQTDCNP